LDMTSGQKKIFMRKIHSLSTDVLYVSILDDDSVRALAQTLTTKLTQ